MTYLVEARIEVAGQVLQPFEGIENATQTCHNILRGSPQLGKVWPVEDWQESRLSLV